jgi:hypothetical protein
VIRGLLISLIVEQALNSFSQALSVGFNELSFIEEALNLGDVFEIDEKDYYAFERYLNSAFKYYLDIDECYGYTNEAGDYVETIIGTIKELK